MIASRYKGAKKQYLLGKSFVILIDMSTSPAGTAFVQNYDALAQSGVLQKVELQQQKIHNLEQLLSQAVEIFNQQSPEELVQFLTSCIVDRFIPSHLAFYFYDHDAGKSIKTLSFDNLRPASPRVQLESLNEYRDFFDHYPNSIDYQLFAYKIHDIHLAERFLPLKPAMIVPLIGREGLFGLIVIGMKVLGEEYKPDEMLILDKLMKFASISLQNNIYYTSAITDYKTRLFNHAYFMRRLREEIAYVRRNDSCFAILAIDIDNFKVFNDKYGHLAGDRILFSLARNLEENLREEDVLSRFGGEEFFVLLVQTSLPTSVHIAERLRQACEEMSIDYDGKKLQVQISIGVNHVHKECLSDENSLINQADSALYQSKNRGRNQVSIFNPGFLFKAQQIKHE